MKTKTINKKAYNDFIELTASELRVVSRMAERMAQEAEALEANDLQHATQEKFDHLWIMHDCMRSAFHAMHKGYGMAIEEKFGRGYNEEIRNALNHLGETIENIESRPYTSRK